MTPTVMPGSKDNGSVARSGRKLSSRAITATAIAGVVVLFAVFNDQTVTIHWVVTTTRTPLIVVIAACGLLGFAVGSLLARRAASRKAR